MLYKGTLKIYTVDLMVPAVGMLFVCVTHGFSLWILIMHLVSSRRQLLHTSILKPGKRWKTKQKLPSHRK